MRLIFARHGESRANVERIISNRDLPHHLTEQGKTEANALADRLENDPICALYASSLLRAQETAHLVAQHLGLDVVTTDALREFDCGVAEGRGDADAWQAHNDVVRAWDETLDYDRRIEDGESFNDMRARFLPFIDSVVDSFGSGDGDVLCISHGSVLTQMLPLVFANVDREFTRSHGLGNCTCIVASLNNGKLVCSVWDDRSLEQSTPT